MKKATKEINVKIDIYFLEKDMDWEEERKVIADCMINHHFTIIEKNKTYQIAGLGLLRSAKSLNDAEEQITKLILNY